LVKRQDGLRKAKKAKESDKMKLQLMGDIFAGLIAASVFLFSALMLKPAKKEEKGDDA
jgi:hypothetical protein